MVRLRALALLPLKNMTDETTSRVLPFSPFPLNLGHDGRPSRRTARGPVTNVLMTM